MTQQHPSAVLFDYYGVIGVDPLVAWKQNHKLGSESWVKVIDICQQSDAGVIDLPAFYEQLGLSVVKPPME